MFYLHLHLICGGKNQILGVNMRYYLLVRVLITYSDWQEALVGREQIDCSVAAHNLRASEAGEQSSRIELLSRLLCCCYVTNSCCAARAGTSWQQLQLNLRL